MALGALGTGLAAFAGGAAGAGLVNWINNRNQNRRMDERLNNWQHTMNAQNTQYHAGFNAWNTRLNDIYGRLNQISAGTTSPYALTQPVYHQPFVPVPYHMPPIAPPVYSGNPFLAPGYVAGGNQYFTNNFSTMPMGGNTVNYISAGNQYFGMDPAQGVNPYVLPQPLQYGGNTYIGGTQNFYGQNNSPSPLDRPAVVNNYYNPVLVMDEDRIRPNLHGPDCLPWPRQTNYDSLPGRLNLEVATYV